MAIDDLPMPLVTFLNVIGVPWPYINEDQVHSFAGLVRDFGNAVQTTHEDATKAVSTIAGAHRAASTEKMLNGWERLSAQHVTEIVDLCKVLAPALDVAADYIVAQKVAAIADLVVMAAAFVADQAAAVVTLGLSELAVPAIIAAGRAVMESLIQDLVQYVIGQVVEAAAKPLFAKVEAMLTGLDWSGGGSGGALAGAAGTGAGLELDAASVRAQTALLRTHAATMRGHAVNFSSGVQALGF